MIFLPNPMAASQATVHMTWGAQSHFVFAGGMGWRGKSWGTIMRGNVSQIETSTSCMALRIPLQTIRYLESGERWHTISQLFHEYLKPLWLFEPDCSLIATKSSGYLGRPLLTKRQEFTSGTVRRPILFLAHETLKCHEPLMALCKQTQQQSISESVRDLVPGCRIAVKPLDYKLHNPFDSIPRF